MADPIFQTERDDIGPAYLTRREQARKNENLEFLLAGSAEAGEAQATPAGSVGKTVIKELPQALVKQGADDAVQEAEGFEWSVENVLDAAGRGVWDFGKGSTVELPRAVGGGIVEGTLEAGRAVTDLSEWLSDNVPAWLSTIWFAGSSEAMAEGQKGRSCRGHPGNQGSGRYSSGRRGPRRTKPLPGWCGIRHCTRPRPG